MSPAQKRVLARNLKNGEEYEETYDKLILSPGAYPLKPPIPGIEQENIFTLRTVPDTDLIKQFIGIRPESKQARIAADNIVLGNRRTYQGSLATAIAKVFELTVGFTGLSEKVLKSEDIPYLANRILVQNRFQRVFNLSGGYKTYPGKASDYENWMTSPEMERHITFLENNVRLRAPGFAALRRGRPSFRNEHESTNLHDDCGSDKTFERCYNLHLT